MKKAVMKSMGTAYAMAQHAELETGANDAGVVVTVTTEEPGMKFAIVINGSKFGEPLMASETSLAELTKATAEAVKHAWATE